MSDFGVFDELAEQTNRPTLQDQFAMAALIGMLTAPNGYFQGNCDQHAQWAYDYADAMLQVKARQENGEQP